METDLKLKICEDRTDENKDMPYLEVVGVLIYISATTKLDIGFTVISLDQFNHYYIAKYWKSQNEF